MRADLPMSLKPGIRIQLMTAFVIVGTFVTGAITGAGVYHWARPSEHWQPHWRGPMARWLRALDLTPEQDRQATAIMERYRPRLESVLRATYPQVRSVNDALERELTTILTPDQQRRLSEMRAKRPHFGRHFGRGHGSRRFGHRRFDRGEGWDDPMPPDDEQPPGEPREGPPGERHHGRRHHASPPSPPAEPPSQPSQPSQPSPAERPAEN